MKIIYFNQKIKIILESMLNHRSKALEASLAAGTYYQFILVFPGLLVAIYLHCVQGIYPSYLSHTFIMRLKKYKEDFGIPFKSVKRQLNRR